MVSACVCSEQLVDGNQACFRQIGLFARELTRVAQGSRTSRRRMRSQLRLSISRAPDRDSARRCAAAAEPSQVFARLPEFSIELAAACHLFEQLRTANEQIPGVTAGVERLDQQLEQTRIHRQHLEKQTAQSVGFNETDELIKRCIRIGRRRRASCNKSGRSLRKIWRVRGAT